MLKKLGYWKIYLIAALSTVILPGITLIIFYAINPNGDLRLYKRLAWQNWFTELLIFLPIFIYYIKQFRGDSILRIIPLFLTLVLMSLLLFLWQSSTRLYEEDLRYLTILFMFHFKCIVVSNLLVYIVLSIVVLKKES